MLLAGSAASSDSGGSNTVCETLVSQQQVFFGEGEIWRNPSPPFFHGLMRNSFLLLVVICLVFFSVPQCLCGEGIPPTAAPDKNLSAPVVTYQNGELTIEAHHSALSDILRAVSMQTGAAIDFPPEVDRPVGGQIGPGQAVGVLARMLKSLGCDYVILASVAHPQVPVRMILFAKPVISTPTQLVQGSPPAQISANLSTDAAVVEEESGDREVQQQQGIQRLATVRQELMERLNARGKQ